jgi:hypothetical protein
MRRALVGVALVGLALVAACGGGGGDTGTPEPARLEPPPEALVKDSESGPVKAKVQLWPTAPQLGDPIHLRLTVESKAGTTAEAPFEHEALGRFRVIGWTHDTRRSDDGGVVEEQTYTLDAPGSGKFRVPPLRIEFRAAGAAGDAAASELLTEELPLTVAAIDPARAAQPLAPPQGKLDARGKREWKNLMILGYLGVAQRIAILVAIVMVIIVAIWRRLRHRDHTVQVSAYELAMARLARLAEDGAPDGSRADAWFVELSAVVRQYVENRYGVRAPELTTEEFLHEARRAAELLAPQRELLSAFLERCDRVKFAGYRPDADESMATLQAARAFVEETRVRVEEAA